MSMTPAEIAATMYAEDAMSQWLGIDILSMDLGSCTARMTVRDEMLNGFKIAHGGISYSFADSAFAFASNSHGRHAVSIETSISHLRAIYPGEILTAVASCLDLSPKLGQYQVIVTNENDERVALFKGTVYRKKAEWINEN